VIRNDGPGTARHLQVRIDGGPVAEHPIFSKVRANRDVPTSVGPGGTIILRYVLTFRPMLKRSRSTVSLSWEDDSGEPGSYEIHLDLTQASEPPLIRPE
jgi:hypothetical protein